MRCGGTLPERPAWTCAFDGKAIYGDLYIHHADALRSERPLDGAPAPPRAALAGMGEWAIPAFAVVLAIMAARFSPRRSTPK